MTRGWDKKMQRRQDKANRKSQRRYERWNEKQNKEYGSKWWYKYDGGWAIRNKVKVSKKSLVGIIIFAAVILILYASTLYQWPQANAETLNPNTTPKPLLSITRSDSCILLYKANNGCIDNRYLVESYDNTNVLWSGGFVEKNGDLVRESPPTKKAWQRYIYADINKIVAVDPDNEWDRLTATQHVVIEPTNFVFVNKQKNTNGTLDYYNNISIDGCYNIRVIADKELIQKAILYLYNDCVGPRPDVITKVVIPQTDIKLMDYKGYRYGVWLKEAQSTCRTLCGDRATTLQPGDLMMEKQPTKQELQVSATTKKIIKTQTDPVVIKMPKHYIVELKG